MSRRDKGDVESALYKSALMLYLLSQTLIGV